MRNRIRLLGALLAAGLVGIGAPDTEALADGMSKKSSRKKASSKKSSGKKSSGKKSSGKKSSGKKSSKKKKGSNNTPDAVAISEPGTATLMAVGVAAAVAGTKLRQRRKKRRH